jgi:hypothetical protein
MPGMEPPPPRPPRDAGGAAACSGPFVEACKRVSSVAALAQWQASPAHADLLGFVRALADAVRGVTLTAPVPVSPAVAAIVDVLSTLEARCACALLRAPARCAALALTRARADAARAG